MTTAETQASKSTEPTELSGEEPETCKAKTKFKLGDRAEANVICTLAVGHKAQHWAIDFLGDGRSIIYRWL